MNNSIKSVDYPTHILHSAAQIAYDVLSVGSDDIVMKLLSYFISLLTPSVIYLVSNLLSITPFTEL